MLSLGPIHHVGIACRDLETVRAWIHQTHTVVRDSGVVHDPLQPADLCLLEPFGGPFIELVSGPIVAAVIKKGGTYYHVCYGVGDLDRSIDEASSAGCRAVSPPKPAVLFGGRRVAFLLGPTGLIELLEQP